MAEIKPIETVYNGYRFRSRLEARWAVFFDALGIKYEYELEGYELIDGTYYLPDFYLPDYKMFVEIKPEYIAQDKEKRKELNKKMFAFTDSTGYAIFLAFGDPACDIWGTAFVWEKDDKKSIDFNARFADISEHEKNPNVILFVSSWQKKTVYISNDKEINNRVCTPFMLIDICWDYIAMVCNIDAMGHVLNDRPSSTFDIVRVRARQARFEHGERG